MLCTSFENLTPLEKTTYIGKLVHIFQSDETYYQQGLKLIRQSEKRGLFNGVEIQPENWSNVPPDETVNNIDNPEKEVS